MLSKTPIFAALLSPLFIVMPDDGWLGSRGGSVFPIIRNENISMIKEEIYINIDKDSCSVSCKFWFKNESNAPQLNIYMGFPDAYNDEPGSVVGPEPLRNFTCKIKGLKKAVKKETQISNSNGNHTSQMFYPTWYCWHIDFKPNETIFIENTYTGNLGGFSDGSRVFTYIIGTANTWHNPIGYGKVVFNYAQIISNYSANKYTKDESEEHGKGMTIKTYQDSTVFLFKDYRPKNSEELEVWFQPIQKK